MSHRANRNLVLKAAARFTKGLLCVIAPGPTRPTLKRYQPPRPALTVRVGVAGHLYIPETDELKSFVGQIFSAVALAANNLNDRHVRLLPGNQSNSQTAGLISLIRDAASQPVTEIDALIRRFRAAGRLSPPQPRCRLITSLASGADQFAAAIARDRHHFQIEAILPFPCDRFRRDIFNNCLTADFVPRQLRHRFALFSVERFENLCASAARVLQLEGAGTPRDAYRNAAEELLGHSDILLVLVGSQATDSGPGSSLWLVRRAREERVPVLRIYTDLCGSPRDPAWLSLLDGDSETPLEISALAPEIHKLMERILLPPPDVEPLRDSGFFERRYRARLDPEYNYCRWCDHWNHRMCSGRGAVDGLADVYREAVVWSDHRASSYAEMSRGAVVFTAAFGLLAVAGAVGGVLFPVFGIPGKVAEILSILLALLLIWRSHNHRWHDRWLGYRQIERRLLHTAILAATGESVRNVHVSNLLAMPSASRWPEWYVGAVQRYAGVPAISISGDWVSASSQSVRDRLIQGQIEYFQGEALESEETDEWLERWILRSLVSSVTLTVLFLGFHFATQPFLPSNPALENAHLWFKNVATCAGALGPATAAALAAIRGHGEYKQQALRYLSAAELLKTIRGALHPGSVTMADVRDAARRSATVLSDELFQWRNVRSEKRIELG